MKNKFVLAMALAIGAASVGAAEQRVTAKEAEAMVKKGVVDIKNNPRDKAMADPVAWLESVAAGVAALRPPAN